MSITWGHARSHRCTSTEGVFLQNFNLDTDLDVKVLTTGFWPSYKSAEQLALPRQMVECVEAFQKFYTDTTKHRNLSWIHNLVCPALESCAISRVQTCSPQASTIG